MITPLQESLLTVPEPGWNVRPVISANWQTLTYAQLLRPLHSVFAGRNIDAFWHSPLFQKALALAKTRAVDHVPDDSDRIPIPGALVTSGSGKSRLLYELVNARGLTLPPGVDFASISVSFNYHTPFISLEERRPASACLAWRIVHYVHPELTSLQEDLATVLRDISVRDALRYALEKRYPDLAAGSRQVIVLLAVDEVTRLPADSV